MIKNTLENIVKLGLLGSLLLVPPAFSQKNKQVDDKEAHQQASFALFSAIGLENNKVNFHDMTYYGQGLLSFEQVQAYGMRREIAGTNSLEQFSWNNLKTNSLINTLFKEAQLTIDLDSIIKEEKLNDISLTDSLGKAGSYLFDKLYSAYNPNSTKEIKELNDNLASQQQGESLSNLYSHYLSLFYQRQMTRLDSILEQKGLTKEQVENHLAHSIMQRKIYLVNDLDAAINTSNFTDDSKRDMIANLAGPGRALKSHALSVLINPNTAKLRDGSTPIEFGSLMNQSYSETIPSFTKNSPESVLDSGTVCNFSIINAKQSTNETSILNEEFTTSHMTNGCLIDIHYTPNFPQQGLCQARVSIRHPPAFNRIFADNNFAYLPSDKGRFKLITANHFDSSPTSQYTSVDLNTEK
jgi:hypothetical protein